MFPMDPAPAIHASNLERTVMSNREITAIGPREIHRRRERLLAAVLWIGLFTLVVALSA